ncbi:MAG: hypothetical protein AAF501_06365 [Pseudomonadota bacterium]
MDLYNRVRRACHIEGMSKSAAARLFGIDRKTVAKILQHALPPGYRRNKPPVRPKLDAFIPIIDQILEEDKARIKKQPALLVPPDRDVYWQLNGNIDELRERLTGRGLSVQDIQVADP